MAEAKTKASTNTKAKTASKGSKKNLIISIVCAVVAIVAVVALAIGLSNHGGGTPKVGSYELVGLVENGEDMSDQLGVLKTLGMEITLEIKDNNTGVLSTYGEETEFSYDGANIIVEDETRPYTYSDGTFTIEDDGVKMTFQFKE